MNLEQEQSPSPRPLRFTTPIIPEGVDVDLLITPYAESNKGLGPSPRVDIYALDTEHNSVNDFMPGEPIGTLTLNMDTPPPPGSLWFKDYAENEGTVEWLVEQGLIEELPMAVKTSGFVTISAHRPTGRLASAIEAAKAAWA